MNHFTQCSTDPHHVRAAINWPLNISVDAIDVFNPTVLSNQETHDVAEIGCGQGGGASPGNGEFKISIMLIIIT